MQVHSWDLPSLATLVSCDDISLALVLGHSLSRLFPDKAQLPTSW